MNCGISTSTFYPETTEKSLDFIINGKFPCCELFLNAFSEVEPDFISELAKKAQNGGVEVVSIHPFTSFMEPMSFFTPYERRFTDGLELYKKYFNAINILDAKYLVFHGDNANNRFSVEEGIERLGVLCALAKSFGVTLAHENVCRCKSRSLDYLMQLARSLPDLRFTLDIKQALRSDVDPFRILENLTEKVVHLHVSDSLPEKDCLPPGVGSFDFVRLFSLLKKLHYQGACIVELYRDSYCSIEELYESHKFLSKLL